ncbi:MAG: thiamine biosynthesis protein ThiF [Chloroflexi bacterium]|nr:thiamine biosynthesis protein ThiF [Chloroflexota bacterium]
MQVNLHVRFGGGQGEKQVKLLALCLPYWLAPSIARLARVLAETGKQVAVTFVDPDVVEEVNVPRQNFCAAEVGRFKAETLARRFSGAWGIPITTITERWDKQMIREHWSATTILVGCVDNPAARRSLADALANASPNSSSPIWWLDCGNWRDNGQVLLGNVRTPKELREAFQIETLCAALPSPALVHPELLTALPHASRAAPPPGGSCAQMALAHAQSLMINQRVASEAADYLARLLLASGSRDGGLCRFATYFDLISGSARSLYTTPETIAAALHTTPTKLFRGKSKRNRAAR